MLTDFNVLPSRFDKNSDALKPLRCFPPAYEKQLLIDHFRTFCCNASSQKQLNREALEVFNKLQTSGYAVVQPTSQLKSILFNKNELLNNDILECTNLLKSSNDNVGYISIKEHHEELIACIFSTGQVLSNVFSAIFGAGNWELTTAQLFSARRSKMSTADRPSPYFWHRDSIGRRFKVWIVLEQNQNSPSTWLLANSNIQDPMPRQWEMFRADKNFKSSHGAEFNKLVSEHPDFVHLNYNVHDIVILDTNSIHKGDYSPIHSSDNFKSRVFLELSVRSKLTGQIFDNVNGIHKNAHVKIGPSIRHLFSRSHLST